MPNTFTFPEMLRPPPLRCAELALPSQPPHPHLLLTPSWLPFEEPLSPHTLDEADLTFPLLGLSM